MLSRFALLCCSALFLTLLSACTLAPAGPSTPVKPAPHCLCEEGRPCSAGLACTYDGSRYCCGGAPCDTFMCEAVVAPDCTQLSDCGVGYSSCINGKCVATPADLSVPVGPQDMSFCKAPQSVPGCRSGLGFPIVVGTLKFYACPGVFAAGQAQTLCASGYRMPSALPRNCSSAVATSCGAFSADTTATEPATAAPSVCSWSGVAENRRLALGCADTRAGVKRGVKEQPPSNNCGGLGCASPGGECGALINCGVGLEPASSFSCPVSSGTDADLLTQLSNSDPLSGVVCYQ